MRDWKINKEKVLDQIGKKIDEINRKEKHDDVIYITSKKDRILKEKYGEIPVILINELEQELRDEIYLGHHKFLERK